VWSRANRNMYRHEIGGTWKGGRPILYHTCIYWYEM